jgi:hypothetical protein
MYKHKLPFYAVHAWLGLALSSLILAASTPSYLLHQYSDGTWIEALAVRSNGLILATDASAPHLYSVNPFHGTSDLVFTFPSATGAVGIVEVRPEFFVVVVGTFSLQTYLGETGSFSLWAVEYSRCGPGHPGPIVTKYMDWPEAKFGDGLTTLPGRSDMVLGADLNLGVVFRLDLKRRTAEIAVADPLMDPGSTVIGVDGIKILNNTLYFTNPGQEIIGAVPIDSTGSATGPSRVIAPIGGDDFAIAGQGGGRLFTVGGSDVLSQIDLASLSVHNLTMLPGPTACQFGRTLNDTGCLYVTTSGGDAEYAQLPVSVGGGIYAVDVFGNNSCPQW